MGHGLAAANEDSGVEAAETRESDARERGRECGARDGTVGVAQYVMVYPTGHRGKESMSGSQVSLVGLVHLVHLVHQVCFVQPTLETDQTDQMNKTDRRLDI